MSQDVKTIKIVTCCDDKANYCMWAKKFISAGATRGYVDLLSGDVVASAHDEELDPNKEEDQAKIKAREANKKAYNDLILVCERETSFNIVEEVYSDKLPKGDARLAQEKLEKKFMPDTNAIPKSVL